MLLLVVATFCWDTVEPFECFDPPYTRGAPEGYFVYSAGMSMWRRHECCWQHSWRVVSSVPAAVDESPCATFDEENPPPGYMAFYYVSAWNSAGESSRAQPACHNPPREGINPTPCPDGHTVGAP